MASADEIDPNLEDSKYSGAMLALTEVYNALQKEYLEQCRANKKEFDDGTRRLGQQGKSIEVMLREFDEKMSEVQRETVRRALIRMGQGGTVPEKREQGVQAGSRRMTVVTNTSRRSRRSRE